MGVTDLVNRMLVAAPLGDANGLLGVLKLAQAILDEKHVPYPRSLTIPMSAYRTLSAAGAKFLEPPVASSAAGLVYGFYLVVDTEADVPHYQPL